MDSPLQMHQEVSGTPEGSVPDQLDEPFFDGVLLGSPCASARTDQPLWAESVSHSMCAKYTVLGAAPYMEHATVIESH
jgi:hypothetical protein